MILGKVSDPRYHLNEAKWWTARCAVPLFVVWILQLGVIFPGATRRPESFRIVFLCEKLLCQGMEVFLHSRRVPVNQASRWSTVARSAVFPPLYGYVPEGILHCDRGGIEAEKFSDNINRRDFAERHQRFFG